MNILLTSSEAVPFAKTGGLADVTTALAATLANSGHNVLLVIPDYPRLRTGETVGGYTLGSAAASVRFEIAGRKVTGSLLEARNPRSRVRVVLVSCPVYFDRPGLYGVGDVDFGDNCERFSFFSRAVLETARALDFRPDVVHANDWQTALVPALLETEFRHVKPFTETASVFTIHNLAYQGRFPGYLYPLTGLPPQYFRLDYLEFYGDVNLLKAGIAFADKITTVSPTYAKEIQTPEFGCGLEAVLRSRRKDLIGILNGIDPAEWDPSTDPHLPAHYTVETWSRPDAKPACKAALQKACGLPQRPDVPLLGMVTRLADQKGVDLLVQIADSLLAEDVQLCILGTGSPQLERSVRQMAERHSQKCSATIGFSEELARRIEAGSDAFLMPSRYEPCGLNQMYSLRYGTVPIVRHTGGLADTVTDATPEAVENGTATGFVFGGYSAEGFHQAVLRAIAAYREPEQWRRIVEAGMRQDFSWQRRAEDYVAVYEAARQASAERRRPAEGKEAERSPDQPPPEPGASASK